MPPPKTQEIPGFFACLGVKKVHGSFINAKPDFWPYVGPEVATGLFSPIFESVFPNISPNSDKPLPRKQENKEINRLLSENITRNEKRWIAVMKTRWVRLFALALLTFGMLTASGCSDNRPVDEPNNASTDKTEPATSTAETEIETSSEASREAFHFVNSPLDERFSIITVEYQEQHQAVDLPAVMDAPIYAVADGTVQKAVPDDDAYSKYVLLDHHNGFLTLYAVCNEILVQEGDEVTAGQEIAKVGTTGKVNGPILHFELRDQNGEKLDPAPLLAEVLK